MATAISYRSESGDTYLSIFPAEASIQEIIDTEKECFGEEWAFLFIEDAVTLTLTDDELETLTNEIHQSIEKAQEEEEYFN